MIRAGVLQRTLEGRQRIPGSSPSTPYVSKFDSSAPIGRFVYREWAHNNMPGKKGFQPTQHLEPLKLRGDQVVSTLEAAGRTDVVSNLSVVSVDGKLPWGNSLGLTRKEMPQIPGALTADFVGSLKARGIHVEPDALDPRTIHPTQKEINTSAVGKLIPQMRVGAFRKPALISSDHYVLDGHHTWGAAVALTYERRSTRLSVVKIGMPITSLLREARNYAFMHEIAPKTIGEGSFGASELDLELSRLDALQSWAESWAGPMQFWAQNNIPGKKGFQPKPHATLEGPDLTNTPEFQELVNRGAVAWAPSADYSWGSNAVLDAIDGVTEDQATKSAGYGLAWNSDSDTGGAHSLLEAARQRLGLPGVRYAIDPQAIEAAGRLLDANRYAIDRAFPKGTVTLYRGTDLDVSSGVVGLRPLSSWTTSRTEAFTFGRHVIKATVPASRVAGLPWYGLGNSTHQEVVIYGGSPLPVEVLQ